MVHDEYDPFIDEIAQELRQPVAFDAHFDARVMAALSPSVIPISVHRSGRPWYRQTFSFSLSQLGGLAAAAALVGVVAMSAVKLRSSDSAQVAARQSSGMRLQPAANLTTAASNTEVQQQFIIVVPTATSMSLVGEFNDWDATRNPMTRVSDEGAWSITIPLAPGRYEYQFVVDGTDRITDPTRPQASSDFAGSANSVVTVESRE